MSEERELNPYAAPKEAEKSAKRTKKKARAENNDDETIQEIVRSFQKTRSWIALFGVLSYIGTAVLIIAGIAVAFISSGTKAGVLSSLGPGILLLYLILGIVYAVIGARLLRYRDAIDKVVRSDGRLEDIAEAVERQSQFWSLVGQFTLVMFGLYVVSAMIGAVAGAAATR